jgi:glycosyltransferase involved in cell wall biosynthesis
LPWSPFSSPHDGREALRTDPSHFHPVTIAHVQPANLPMLAARHPRLFGRHQAVVSVCYWETDRVKRIHRIGSPLLDEIWTLSEFSADALRTITSKPVLVMPYPIAPPAKATGALRRYLGLGEEFVFSFQFDMGSTTMRKNPEAVISAYRRAFPAARSDVRLLIKTMHSDWFPQQFASLVDLCRRCDILLVDEFWPEAVNDTYYSDIDCFVSLHRAEGLGIGMARAMAAGKVVIGTGFSGNLDFMNESNSILVPADVVPVGPNPVYPASSHWAEPDVDAAVDAMRFVYEDAHLRERLGKQASADLEGRSSAAFGEWMADQVLALS